MRAEINGAELCVDTIGDPAHPAVLLIMGAAASMDRWEEPFCARLAAAGRHVIRYDQRDTGGSTTYPAGRPGYTGDDLVADALGILDHLGVERAHLVGISMGGGIVRVYDRSTSLPSANNHFLLEGSDMARARLGEITGGYHENLRRNVESLA